MPCLYQNFGDFSNLVLFKFLSKPQKQLNAATHETFSILHFKNQVSSASNIYAVTSLSLSLFASTLFTSIASGINFADISAYFSLRYARLASSSNTL